MNRVNKKKLEQFLLKESKEKLIDQLLDLIERFDEVEEYYQTRLNQNRSQILDKYKQKITDALYPDDQWYGGFDLEAVDRIIKKYDKLEPPTASLIKLKLFSIKSATELADCFGGDYGEDYYIYFEEIYEEILKELKREGTLGDFQDELLNIAQKAYEGYGHRDQLMDVYHEYF